MAVCPTLGLLVTSNFDDNTLSVFNCALPTSGADVDADADLMPVLQYKLGGEDSRAPMQFKFNDGNYSGWMAFTGPATSRLLLLTDAGHNAVHVIDVGGRGHAGFVAAPGTISGPRGVAARGSLVAVSAWRGYVSGGHVVRLFEGSGAMWTAVRIVAGGFGGPGSAGGQLWCPYGLRFTGDGTGLAVADDGNGRVSVFRVADGSYVRHVATGLSHPWDVEECEGGWLVACYSSNTIEFVDARLETEGAGDGSHCLGKLSGPVALALFPGRGLVVREIGTGGRCQVLELQLRGAGVALMRLGSGPLAPSLPALKTMCGEGVGLAVCPTLGMLAVSENMANTLSVFALPRSSGAGAGAGTGLVLVNTLGGASSPAPLQFKFSDGLYHSGWMAFTGPATSSRLLVTDAGHDAVHVIDLAGRMPVHVGYVAAPGTIAGPRGVAARGSLVAISAWKNVGFGDHVVRVFQSQGASWSVVRVLGANFAGPGSADGQLLCPYGLRFTVIGDAAGLAVADSGNERVTLFRLQDASCVRHVATGLVDPFDVEECEDGWLVACFGSNTIEFVNGTGGGDGAERVRLGTVGSGDGEFFGPSALALVPSLGLVVREVGNDGRFQVFGLELQSVEPASEDHRYGMISFALTHRGRHMYVVSAL